MSEISDEARALARGFGFWEDGTHAGVIQAALDKARAEEREIRDDHWRRIVDAQEHRLEIAAFDERRRCAARIAELERELAEKEQERLAAVKAWDATAYRLVEERRRCADIARACCPLTGRHESPCCGPEIARDIEADDAK